MFPVWAGICLGLVGLNMAVPFIAMSQLLIGIAASWMVLLAVFRFDRRPGGLSQERLREIHADRLAREARTRRAERAFMKQVEVRRRARVIAREIREMIRRGHHADEDSTGKKQDGPAEDQ